MCLSVCMSDSNQVSEVDEGNNYKGHAPFNMSVALKCCCLGSQVSKKPSVAIFGGKHEILRIQLLFSIIVIFLRIKLLYSSICRHSPNRVNGVAVFEDSRFRYNTHSN